MSLALPSDPNAAATSRSQYDAQAMIGPLRIDQAVAPAGLIRSAVAYSLFVSREGLYAITTGPGWRMQVRGRHRSERMVENVRRVEAELDPSNLDRELATRDGSVFVPVADIKHVVLGRRFDQLPDLRFTDGTRNYRFQFDEDRGDEIEEFAQALSSLPELVRPETDDGSDDHPFVLFEGTVTRTVALPSPCWGATPHIALTDGRIFVQYLTPTGVQHGEAMTVYESTYEEHCDIAYGRTELVQLCQRLIQAAWGATPLPVTESPFSELAEADRAASVDKITRALTLCIARHEDAEQLDRLERLREHEVEQAAFERALLLLR